jgi:hypothetical protein
MKDIHTYGAALKTKWVLVHDTDKGGMKPFAANEMAKAAGATPLKRPENGQFRPGTNFTESSSTKPATPMPKRKRAPNMAASARR